MLVLTLPLPAELIILITTVRPNSPVTTTEGIIADIHEGDTLPPLVSGEVITMRNYPPAIPDHYLPGIPQLSSLPVSFIHVTIHAVAGEFQVCPVQTIAHQT